MSGKRLPWISIVTVENLSLDVPVEKFRGEKGNVDSLGSVGQCFTTLPRSYGGLLYLEADGVYLPHAAAGSSFSRVGVQERNGNSKVVILNINGQQIRNLDDFIAACQTITDGQHTYVVIRDFQPI